jgi:aryl-phospho-beta-D-glucosidase BglC (GH1 family)
MNLLRQSVLSAALCVLSLSLAHVAAARDIFLKTDGMNLRDEHGLGRIVTLHGVNVGGWLITEAWMCPLDTAGAKDDYSVREILTRRFGPAKRDELLATYQDHWVDGEDFARITALGLNTVRLPFWYPNVEDENGVWRTDAFRRLDWFVEGARDHGIYVILDLHGVPGSQSDSQCTGRLRKKDVNGLEPDFWNNETNLARTVEIWRRVAEHFKNNPTVAAYDLINEPSGAPTREALWAFYDRLYRTIRAEDPDHIVCLEGCWGGTIDGHYQGWGWGSLPAPGQFGWTNVMYQQHSYEWDWRSLPKQIANTDRQVADWQQHQKWNVPCLIGEFNCMAPEQGWRYTLDQFNRNNMSWTIWAYKSANGGGEDSWGVYNCRLPKPPVPDLLKDSAEEIKAKWSAWGEGAFVPNPMLARVLNDATPRK